MTSSPSLIPELLLSYLYYCLISVIDSSTRPCLTIDLTLSHRRLDFTFTSALNPWTSRTIRLEGVTCLTEENESNR